MNKEKSEAQLPDRAEPTLFQSFSFAASCRTYIEHRLIPKNAAFTRRNLGFNELRLVGELLLTNATPPQQTLALRCELNRTTVVHSIDRLEKAGLVKRSPSEKDRRVNMMISLTDNGRRIGTEFLDMVEKFQSEIAFKYFNGDDSVVFRRLLEKGCRDAFEVLL